MAFDSDSDGDSILASLVDPLKKNEMKEKEGDAVKNSDGSEVGVAVNTVDENLTVAGISGDGSLQGTPNYLQ
jgi:hypothetical protein